MRCVWACRSDIGVKRKINEDNFKASDEDAFFVVADGMGGHAGGELASRLAVERMAEFVHTTKKGTLEPLPFAPRRDLPPEGNRLYVAARLANREIYDVAVRNPAFKGMGSTAVALLVREREAYVMHVGDSRCYLLRNGKLSLLTRDHSVVNELVDQGQITAEQARSHRDRNVITRALGAEPDVQPEVSVHRLRDGDLFLLCTDGLTDKASERKLLELLEPFVEHEGVYHKVSSDEERRRLDAVAAEMIRFANARGGDDNITAMLVRVRE